MCACFVVTVLVCSLRATTASAFAVGQSHATGGTHNLTTLATQGGRARDLHELEFKDDVVRASSLARVPSASYGRDSGDPSMHQTAYNSLQEHDNARALGFSDSEQVCNGRFLARRLGFFYSSPAKIRGLVPRSPLRCALQTLCLTLCLTLSHALSAACAVRTPQDGVCTAEGACRGVEVAQGAGRGQGRVEAS